MIRFALYLFIATVIARAAPRVQTFDCHGELEGGTEKSPPHSMRFTVLAGEARLLSWDNKLSPPYKLTTENTKLVFSANLVAGVVSKTSFPLAALAAEGEFSGITSDNTGPMKPYRVVYSCKSTIAPEQTGAVDPGSAQFESNEFAFTVKRPSENWIMVPAKAVSAGPDIPVQTVDTANFMERVIGMGKKPSSPPKLFEKVDFIVSTRPFPNGFEDLLDYASKNVAILGKGDKEFHVIQPSRMTTLAGKPAALSEFELSMTIKNVRGESVLLFVLHLKTWDMKIGDKLLQFSIGSNRTYWKDNEAELQKIIDSVAFRSKENAPSKKDEILDGLNF